MAARHRQPTDSMGPPVSESLLASRRAGSVPARFERRSRVEIAVQALTAAIALAALVLSIRATRRQTRLQEQQVTIQEQQTVIQERLAAVEEARRADRLAAREQARVTADIRREQRGGSGEPLRLVLHNEGPAVARGVNLAAEELPQAPGVRGLEVLPVDLQPGQEMKFMVTIGLRTQPTLRVVVRWADAAGDHEVPYTLPTY